MFRSIKQCLTDGRRQSDGFFFPKNQFLSDKKILIRSENREFFFFGNHEINTL
jgi:hypothetical protein